MAKKHKNNKLIRRFASGLKFERKRQGLSQKNLAHLSGLSRTYVSSLERMEGNVTLVTIEKISIALGVPILALFGEVPECQNE